MKTIKETDELRDDFIGRKIAEDLAIDYDENQLLIKEFSNKLGHQKRGNLPYV